ncbi:cysteine synthase family protein [Bacillaceae bacterium Marseille-Q3522]|nr:cysteine synthase family protein [Bacillaceae bacterium Marseille-Q3522]
MKIYRNVQELIGHTPLIEITHFPLADGVRLFAKLEMMNPGGSVKDRLGLELLHLALQEGKLSPGGTLIEPTAGNTGIGLALAAVNKGIQVIFCVPEKFSVEKQVLMKALGAKIVSTPTEEGMQGAINKALQLEKEIPGAYCPQQFSNTGNPLAYYKSLGPEVWHDLDGKVDIFVAGAGTGGTFMGCARYLKEQNPAVKTVIVEPFGSILNGGEASSHKTEGIGMEFLPDYMDDTYFDAIHTIADETAFAMVKEAAVKEGLFIGSSSGAALAAALTEGKTSQPGTNIAVIFPDSSERYLSKKIYEGGI